VYEKIAHVSVMLL